MEHAFASRHTCSNLTKPSAEPALLYTESSLSLQREGVMPGVLSKAVKDQINAMIDKAPADRKAYVTLFKDCVAILEKEKIIYLAPSAHPELFFVHKKNRSGLGLSPRTVHRNGAKIKRVGANLEDIVNAYAFEMPIGPDRQEHVTFNLKLIARSKGLLAQPTGAERFLSVGAGHTVAFCRAAAQHCITTETTIQDENGKLDLQKLCSDPSFKVMIEKGWDWKIIPHIVDKECPKFANVAQMALNASNHIASQIGELEAAQMISDHTDNDDDDFMEPALQAVHDVCAPCAHYAESIGKFVQLYAGGSGAPHIQFVDSVAKQFHCTPAIGEGSQGGIHVGQQPG